MKGIPARILAIIPEISIFVFIAVCLILVLARGGTLRNLFPLIFVFAANIYALKKVLRRMP